jgi:hypothetical protein
MAIGADLMMLTSTFFFTYNEIKNHEIVEMYVNIWPSFNEIS